MSTNEIGTTSHEAASALYHSSAPSVAELLTQYGSVTSSESAAQNAAAALARQSASAARQSTLVSTSSVSTAATAPQVTPEGYVLVPASAAKQVGLSGVEVDQTLGSQLGRTSTRTSSTSRFLSSGSLPSASNSYALYTPFNRQY